MNEGYLDIINNIRQKTELVSHKYHSLLDKYKTLKNEHNSLLEKLEKIEKEKSDLENKLETLKTAKFIEMSSDDKGEAQSRIKRLVKEIDRCIALLNVDN